MPQSMESPVQPSAAPAQHVPVLNAANVLTMLRLLLVPVFGFFLFADGGHTVRWRLAAAGVFLLAAVTDSIDGEIARRRHLVTAVGEVADPIADKALIGTALVGLSMLGDLPWWVTIVVLVREVCVTGLRFWVIRHGVIAASRGGKLKTVLQGAAILLYLLPGDGWLAVLRAAVMGLAVVITVVTGGDYVLRAVRLRTTSERAARKRAARARAAARSERTR